LAICYNIQGRIAALPRLWSRRFAKAGLDLGGTMIRISALVSLCAATIAALTAGASAQDSVAAFYKGKTVSIIAGSSAGGGVDIYARLVGRHLQKHIPGNPSVIVQNMPGAGSLGAARNLYAVAPKDGTQIATVLSGSLFDPLMAGQSLAQFDPTRFGYLGNANQDSIVCVVRRDAPVQSYEQVFEKELVIGGTGPGSSLVDYPVVEKNLLGVKLNLIAGYKGSNEISLAIQQKELQGICGLLWSSAKVQYPDVLKPDGYVKVLVQEDATANPAIAQLGAPLITKFAKSPEIKKVLEVYFEQGAISRPFMAPPGIPPERLAALRKAFMDTINDPELRADAARQKSDVAPQTGEEVDAQVKRIYATPAEQMDILRKAATPPK
jgi:tripartite-type tricarboxylate transporter receptor subunit TctC